MKTIQLLIAVLLFPSLALAEPIKVGDTKATFDPPPGFKSVPKEIIDLKWPSNRAPQFVVGNESASTTVAYDLKPNRIPQDKLGEVRKSFTRLFERIVPGIQWKKNELVEHSGQKWIFKRIMDFRGSGAGRLSVSTSAPERPRRRQTASRVSGESKDD